MDTSADIESAARSPERVVVRLPITLGQFLKVAGITVTGGEAKQVISVGGVRVNDQTETRRGRQLVEGDTVEALGEIVVVATHGPLSDTTSAGDAPGDHTGR